MVTPDSFLPFRKGRGRLPLFLRGFSELVFDNDAGVLLDEPSIEAIYAIRQLTLIFSKILLPCTPERERKAFDDYVQCDSEINEGIPATDKDLSEFSRMASLLFGPIFSKLDRKIFDGSIVPKHGPGATAEKLTSNGKYLNRYWPSRLEDVFHVGDFLYPNARFVSECYDEIDFAEPGAEIPSRVISVPKTQSAPRIIAIEPTAMQYVQQGILEALMQAINEDFLIDLIGTEDQGPNQALAQLGSEDGSLATLDLSEASDRVHSELVRRLLARHPLAKEGVFACRSERASVPGHGIISLAKFASMGSALCFPFEAMVFLTIIFLSLEQEQGHMFTKRSEIKDFIGRVRVYGDDLVVPIDCVHTVVYNLSHFGAKVNGRKSFWTGRFRESCGKEYFEGQDVSIVKVRNLFPSQRQHVTETISLVSLRNQFYQHGCWETVKWLDSKLERILNFFPKVEPSSSALGRHSFLGYQTERVCEHLHRPLVKAYVVSGDPPNDKLDGPGALLKYFLKRGLRARDDGRHLERAGRPRTVRIKTRWVTPF